MATEYSQWEKDFVIYLLRLRCAGYEQIIHQQDQSIKLHKQSRAAWEKKYGY